MIPKIKNQMNDEIEVLIKSEELKEITIDLVEKVLDNEITDEVLKEIPVLKYLVAFKKIYSSYSDRIFIKKAMNVLLELGAVDWNQREELTRELNDDNGSGAEKILMAIDKLETIEKCKVFGRLCRLKALRIIELNDFLRLTKVIQDSYLEDLCLVKDFKKGISIEIYEGDYISLIILGLIFQEPSEPKEIKRNNQQNEDDPEFIGGKIEFNYLLSDTGQALLKNYDNLFPS